MASNSVPGSNGRNKPATPSTMQTSPIVILKILIIPHYRMRRQF